MHCPMRHSNSKFYEECVGSLAANVQKNFVSFLFLITGLLSKLKGLKFCGDLTKFNKFFSF